MIFGQFPVVYDFDHLLIHKPDVWTLWVMLCTSFPLQHLDWVRAWCLSVHILSRKRLVLRNQWSSQGESIAQSLSHGRWLRALPTIYRRITRRCGSVSPRSSASHEPHPFLILHSIFLVINQSYKHAFLLHPGRFSRESSNLKGVSGRLICPSSPCWGHFLHYPVLHAFFVPGGGYFPTKPFKGLTKVLIGRDKG